MAKAREREVRVWWCTLLCLFFFCASAEGEENLLVGGDFEEGLTGWSELWTRTPSGQLRLDGSDPHGGKKAVCIEHTGSQDWSFPQTRRLKVKPGQIYEFQGWVRGEGEGTATLCVILRNNRDGVLDWAHGGRTLPAAGAWRHVHSRFVIPEGAGSIEPRLIGYGPATVWLDDARLELAGTVDELRRQDLPAKVELVNEHLQLNFDATLGTFSVRDKRSGRLWSQPSKKASFVVLDVERSENALSVRILDPASTRELNVGIELDKTRPEFVLEIASSGSLRDSVGYPYPFATNKGDMLIMPVNEGISYPVDDESLPTMSYHLYGGHGLCMGWYGATDGTVGLMTIVETPDDAAVRVPRHDGLLCLAPQWVPQKGEFGDTRRLRYVLLDDGGYVAMCKRYRQHAQRSGRLVTLAEKRESVPAVDLLVGAVNVWCWQQDAVDMCRELKSLGIERILWSHRRTPETLRELNTMGVLTSRYDIYQDVMDPENFPNLRGKHPDWPTEAWPHDIARGADGQWTRGWRVRGKDGEWYPCGVLCDRQALSYARQRIGQELKTHPFKSRFIDTTTAAPWRECYHPDHPMTRTESRRWKMELLGLVNREFGLVTGSETGHDAAVPFVHYFEGMMSLGPYRVPDAGRRMMEPVDDPPERVVKFQTGQYYRLPLWELVFHDCVVAQWYWGDYNNKLPSLWDRRDLFNALYGTPPMFMFNREIWRKHRDRFVQSYHTATAVARATGYSEMLSHRWLTEDHSVQKTEFANGVTVTVNFGDQSYRLPDGTTVEPLSHHFEGLAQE